jgi:hypothetical protein
MVAAGSVKATPRNLLLESIRCAIGSYHLAVTDGVPV